MLGITPGKLVFGTLAVASVFIVVRWLIPWDKNRVNLGAPMGKGSWDINSSWASNFTLIGAVLGSILGASVLPDKTKVLPIISYSALNVFFGAITVLAPFVYIATRTRDPKSMELRGYVWSFFLTSFITLWAVLGELATVALLLNEIPASGSLPTSVAYLFAGLMAGAALLMLNYLWFGIPDTIGAETDRSGGSKRDWHLF